MASPRALRGPIGTRRTAGGTVGPRFIGASPVWAARSSYWRSQCYLLPDLDMTMSELDMIMSDLDLIMSDPDIIMS